MAALSGEERTARVCPEAARTFAAWKTGTSSGHRDAWCAAVTPRRTVVVWLGNPRGQGSALLVGQEAAAPLALRLIALLGPGPAAPWPAVDETPAPQTAARPRAGGITLVSPADGSAIVLTPDAPVVRQRVLLKAAVAGASQADGPTLWWFVDERPVGTGGAEARVWWTPTPGEHVVRTIDARGHAAIAHISVRGAE